MVNINCSEDCIYNTNGMCTLDNISNFSNYVNTDYECAYFISKKSKKRTSQNF